MLRITTALRYDIAASNFENQQAEQVKLFEQISTNNAVVNPSDDPLAAAQGVKITQHQALNTQYTTNRQAATSRLGIEDTTLESVDNSLNKIRTLLVEAGNGSLSDSDRRALATELQSDLGGLVDLANTKDGNGNYLFSGDQGDQAPVSATPVSATPVVSGNVTTSYTYTYVGTSSDAYSGATSSSRPAGPRSIEVSETRQIPTTDTADTIFGFTSSGSIFATVQTAIDTLGKSTSGTTATGTYVPPLDEIDDKIDRVLSTRASVGARMNEVSMLDQIGTSSDLNDTNRYQKLISINQYEAYSKMTELSTSLQASVLAFQQIQNLSLLQNS